MPPSLDDSGDLAFENRKWSWQLDGSIIIIISLCFPVYLSAALCLRRRHYFHISCPGWRGEGRTCSATRFLQGRDGNEAERAGRFRGRPSLWLESGSPPSLPLEERKNVWSIYWSAVIFQQRGANLTLQHKDVDVSRLFSPQSVISIKTVPTKVLRHTPLKLVHFQS